WFRTASEHSTTFYGQLAAARLNKNDGLDVSVPSPIDAAESAEFDRHEVVQVVRLLISIGERTLLSRFIRRLGEINRSPRWLTSVAKLARDGGRADLAISVAKRASREGANLGYTGYPTIPAKTQDGLEAPLLFALIRQESAFDQRAISHAGARGLMQLMPRTARHVARRISKPYVPKRLTEDPAYNINIGQAYLRELLEDFDGSYILALAAYNAGPGRVRRWIKAYGDPRQSNTDAIDWIEMIPISETRNYVQRVIENLHVYRQQLNPSRLAFNPVEDLHR
ncbi:MAG: lytic transglycosylase domain-containing protein, partial [Proteobacteria bacterium]|nr:lytic transglycosylase domain-containing protein [Pseudomonadota bacterium]